MSQPEQGLEYSKILAETARSIYWQVPWYLEAANWVEEMGLQINPQPQPPTVESFFGHVGHKAVKPSLPLQLGVLQAPLIDLVRIKEAVTGHMEEYPGQSSLRGLTELYLYLRLAADLRDMTAGGPYLLNSLIPTLSYLTKGRTYEQFAKLTLGNLALFAKWEGVPSQSFFHAVLRNLHDRPSQLIISAVSAWELQEMLSGLPLSVIPVEYLHKLNPLNIFQTLPPQP